MTHSPSLKWLREIPADFSDAQSYRHMRRFALERIARNAELRAEVVASGGEALAKREWDSVFEQDNADDREAVRLCEEGLDRMGMPL